MDTSNLNGLYQQLIIDHSKNPHNFCVLENSNHSQEGYNPLCGDKITIYINENNGTISDVSFQGAGCAISTASASLMTDAVKGKTIEEALELLNEFQKLITTGKTDNPEKLGKLTVLANVSEFPMRVKCATLAWHTLKAALAKEPGTISTE
jgi:nitrogen fixation protein NifU and related proteins